MFLSVHRYQKHHLTKHNWLIFSRLIHTRKFLFYSIPGCFHCRSFSIVLALALVVLFGLSSGQNLGIRAGVGQFASQAQQIDGKTGNSFMFVTHIVPPKTCLRMELGLRYNGVSESEVSIPTAAASIFHIKRVTQKIGYLGICAGPGISIDMSEIGSGFGAWVSVAGGVNFSTVVTKVDYTDATTPTYSANRTDYTNWKFLGLIGAGVKLRIFYLGIFFEADYYDGGRLGYDAIVVPSEIGDVTPLTESGTIESRGFAAYVGLSWN